MLPRARQQVLSASVTGFWQSREAQGQIYKQATVLLFVLADLSTDSDLIIGGWTVKPLRLKARFVIR
jgi:hypothetical protein